MMKLKSKCQIIDWCNKALANYLITSEDKEYLHSIIALANGIKLPNDYFCKKCNQYFCGVEEYSEYDEMDCPEYYVNCPRCGQKIYVGCTCYWR